MGVIDLGEYLRSDCKARTCNVFEREEAEGGGGGGSGHTTQLFRAQNNFDSASVIGAANARAQENRC